MSKVIIIGIDGMDYGLLTNFLDELPNLSRLSQRGIGNFLQSVFPPDSIPAWITIYTGIGPETHGIVRSIDYLNKDYKQFSVNTEAFRGKTFWDIAGDKGKKVCVINPFMAYPVWPVKGIMVSGPVFITGEAQCYPVTVGEKYGLPNVLGGIVDFPTKRTLDNFVNKCRSDTLQLAEYSLKFFSGEGWDLFFVTFLTLDRVQHFLWRYTDDHDPTYPGKNKYKDSIRSFYRIFDEIIGKYLSAMNKDDHLFVISDHGHGMRCPQNLNLNEYFRKLGYLKADLGKVTLLSKKFWIEKAKQLVLQILFQLDLEDLTYQIARFIPNRDKLKTSKFIINNHSSLIRLSEFAGSGPYGGIEVNMEIEDGYHYDKFCERIIEDLKALNHKHNQSLFKWIKKKGEMFEISPHNKAYPDILFELHSLYGVNWDLFTNLISRNPFHKKISGGHNSSGVIFTNASFLDRQKEYRVHDIKSIILKGLGIGKS